MEIEDMAWVVGGAGDVMEVRGGIGHWGMEMLQE